MPVIPATAPYLELVQDCETKFKHVHNISDNPSDNSPFTPNTLTEILDVASVKNWLSELIEKDISKVAVSFGYYTNAFVNNEGLREIANETESTLKKREGRLTAFLVGCNNSGNPVPNDSGYFNIGELRP